ncbi:MAG TPA: DUF456 domain-containing protein [Gemmatimonadaceae bacterium]|nr:DUF456 domain-containing protein [Gemmatimonadaceae bacterium]
MAILLLSLVLLVSLVLIALGLPGLWVMIASAVAYNFLVPEAPISWFTLIGIAVLGIIAEIIEFSLSGKFARKFGGSRRASWGAIIGGIVGAFMGFPVPIIGPLIGAFTGSFIGALLGELSTGSSGGSSTKVATGALIGRVAATAMKMGIGCAIASWIFLAAMG